MSTLLPILAGGWISIERNRILQTLPQSVQSIWNNWEVRGMVIVTLMFQIVLSFLGNRRKLETRSSIKKLVWFANYVADTYARLALGIISSKVQNSNNNEQKLNTYVMVAIWGPILLIHLGGPDTFTAYSREDNDLWSRNLVGLTAQVITLVIINIFAGSWNNNKLYSSWLSILLLLVGIIKCSERVLAQRFASIKRSHESLLPSVIDTLPKTLDTLAFPVMAADGEKPDVDEGPSDWNGPDFTHFPADDVDCPLPHMAPPKHCPGIYHTYWQPTNESIFHSATTDEYCVGISNPSWEPAQASIDIDDPQHISDFESSSETTSDSDGSEEETEKWFIKYVSMSRRKFKQVFESLFIDLVLSDDDLDEFRSVFTKLKAKEAFELLEFELGLAYDILYTKAYVLYTASSKWVILSKAFRAFSFVFSFCSLIIFSIRWNERHWQFVSNTDRIITILLLLGNFILEYHAFVVLHRSQWTYDLGNNATGIAWSPLDSLVQFLPDCFAKEEFNPVRYVKRPVGQFSLLRFCIECKTAEVTKVEKYKHLVEYPEMSLNLKKLIFKHVKKEAKIMADETVMASFVLQEIFNTSKYEKLPKTEVEFHQGILTWHIATEICYFMDEDGHSNVIKAQLSRTLSHYLLYILIWKRHMLPKGTGAISTRDTCVETRKVLEEWGSSVSNNVGEISRKFFMNEVAAQGKKPSKSVLSDACKLAKEIMAKEKLRVWAYLADIWLKRLCYAASHCLVEDHAKELGEGGELLTVVWILLAQVGSLDQFPRKLITSNKKME